MNNNGTFSFAQEEHTIHFLEDWLLYHELSGNSASGDDSPAMPRNDFRTVRNSLGAPGPYAPLSPESCAGEVRLLSQPNQLQYVLILKNLGMNYLVAPFSAFASPATDAELLMKVSGGQFLRVLQLWNVRTLHHLQLMRSWSIHFLDETLVEEAWKIREYFLTDSPVKPELRQRTGVPIFNPADPRVTYQTEAVRIFSEMDARDMRLAEYCGQLLEPPEHREAVLKFENPLEPLPMAAESEPLLSPVIDTGMLAAEQILAELAKNRIPGRQTGFAERLDLSGAIWKSPRTAEQGYTLIFYDYTKQMLLGFGDLQQEHETMLYYLRNSAVDFDGEKLPPMNDIAILIGE